MTKLFFIPEILGVSLEVYVISFVLGLPTFFFWRWLLKKFITANRTRKIASWTATIILTPLIYVSLVLICIFSITYYPNHDFDRKEWFENKEKRYELSQDIIKSKILFGKTKAEVREMLGDENNTENNNSWGYYLGYRPGLFNIDPDYLDIKFENGKVSKVGQHES